VTLADPDHPRPPRTDLPAPPAIADHWALFLDFDGTLVDIADRPGGVVVENGLTERLAALEARLGGALAIVTGRPLGQVDALLAPLKLKAAGHHGLELRRHDGDRPAPPDLPRGFEAAHDRARRFAEARPEIYFETKPFGFALHYRMAAHMAELVAAEAATISEMTDPPLRRVAGKMVVELGLAGHSKGTAVQSLMAAAPFTGRLPVFVGDDVTDEDGFTAVNALGGLSVLVGARDTAATHALPDPAALRAWLHR